VFQDHSSERAPVLKIAGFHEMSRPGQDVSADKWSTLKRAFEALGYDLGVLTPETARRMREKADGIPRGWLAQQDRTRSRVLRSGNQTIGVLVFPTERGENGYSEIAATARKMSSKTSLLIGLSPWGARKEKDFLRQRPEAVDILLGSGPGPSFKAKTPDSGKTLWVRAYSEGKAVHRIDLAHLEPQNPKRSWVPGENVSIRLIMLRQHIREHPSLREIIR